MSKVVGACLWVGSLAIATSSWALTGDEWKKLTDLAQMAYVLAVLDTWDETKDVAQAIEKHAVLPEGKTTTLQALLRNYTDVGSCVDAKKMTKGEIYNTVKRWTDAHPDEREYSMSALVWLALREECGGPPPTSTK